MYTCELYVVVVQTSSAVAAIEKEASPSPRNDDVVE